MDINNLKGLMEAYQQVNAPQQIDESKHDSIASSGGGNRRARKSADMRKPYNDTMRRQDQLAMSKGKPFNDRVKKDSPMQYKSNEEVDIYDIVLSHLLDEGYADTIESAEAIMVNMSEEWREEILDEMQYTAPPQPAAIVRPAPSKINRAPEKINQQRSKGAGMAAQAALGLGAYGAVAASNRRERKKYKM